MNHPSPARSSRWRGWLRLSLRGLMVMILILGGALGYVVRLAQIQRAAVAVVRRYGNVAYDWQIGTNGMNQSLPPPAPEWLVRWLGPDFFGHVVWVELGSLANDEALVHAARLDQVTELRVFGPEVTDAGLVQIGNLRNLQALWVGNARRVASAGWSGVARLHRLKMLRLGQVHVGDAGMVHLSGLTTLTLLDASETGITDAGLVPLRNLTALNCLRLNSLPITSAGLRHLQPLHNLTSLALAETRVTEVRPLAAMPQLLDLDLNRSPITDAGLAAIGQLPRLRSVALDGTAITDAGLAHLTNPGLRVASLFDTAVSAAGAARFRQARPDVKVGHHP